MGENSTASIPSSLAADLIIQGAEIVAKEHDQMRSFAIMSKREPKQSLELCLAELEAFPEQAERAYYRLPRRAKVCRHGSTTTCKNCNFIEGPSVNTARVVARNWGNCTVGVRVYAETDDFWDLDGRFLDFETNFSATRGLRVLKRVKWKGELKHVRDLDPTVEFQIFQSGVSKCFRNVVRDGIPEAIIDRYWTTARKLVAGDAPGKKLSKTAVKKILTAFAEFQVSPEMLEEKIGRPMDKWTGNDAAELKGLHNALVDGHSSIGTMFGAEVQEPQPIEEDGGEKGKDELFT